MKNRSFRVLLGKISPVQRSVLEELECIHSDLMWTVGRKKVPPLQVQIRNVKKQHIASVSVYRKKPCMELRFRGSDYSGLNVSPVKDRIFDKTYLVMDSANLSVASGILSTIKLNYT